MAMGRVMEVTTPLGDDLLFHRLFAREEVSRLSDFQLDLLSPKKDVNLDDVLGKSFTVKLQLPDSKIRHFNGYVTRFAQAGMHGRYHAYRATLRPWLWFLTRTADCRIFQDKTVPEIVEEIFADHGTADFKSELTGNYTKWEYCVQYRETDFNFVSRLMEQEGIYYYFTHDDGRHTMVLADSASGHSPFPGYEQVPFFGPDKVARPEQDHIGEWYYSREIQPGVYTINDYDFERPSVGLVTKQKISRKHGESDYEMFDYPGEYVQKADGDQFVQTRLDELQSQYELANGTSNCRGVATGCLFKLTGQERDDQNREYLVLAATHQLEFSEYEAMEAGGASYSCGFTVLNSKQQFRPQRLTPKPTVQGPQTAVVVGPDGDEIYTDKYGRVKVQFHWDRYGKKNENSSCWVRVSHPWAGKNWGFVAIPRIGQEVIVDFLEGDPDQPIITGRVYNAEQMPPYDLPANATQSGVKSRSSKGGSGSNFNEIRFEDKSGSEQLYIHAEKNQDNLVENDETTDVGHDRTEKVANNEKITIGVDRTENVGNNETIGIGVNRTETVGANETINIGSNRSVTVGGMETKKVALQRTHLVGANETIGVGGAQEVAVGGFQAIVVGGYQTSNVGGYQSNNIGANQSTTVGADRSVKVSAAQTVDVNANASMKVGGDESRSVTGGRSTSIGKDDALKVGKNLVIDAGESVTVKTGSASITMKKDGTITIKGKDITIDGSGKINVKASGEIVMKGSKILQN